MRFESLLWTALAMFLMGGAGWNGDSLVGGMTGRSAYQQAADGGSEVPPPLWDGGSEVPPPSNLDGGSEVPPPTVP